jgi:hypothetical protein
MSIPERLWRVVKGRWAMSDDRFGDPSEQLAAADAYQELADVLRHAPPPAAVSTPQGTSVLPPPGAAPAGQHDPLEACYALLSVSPGCDLRALEEAYETRMDEIRPEDAAAGSPERAALEARRSAVQAAYDKLRDTLNPTETRFEHLEFE